MNLQNLFLTTTMLLSVTPFSYSATPNDAPQKNIILSEKSLTISLLFKPMAQDKDLFGASSLSYTFSSASAGTINYVRLCKATDDTCSSCDAPFRVINAGTPIPYSTLGTTYSVSPTTIASYLQSSGLPAGSYNIGFYVQSTEFNCSSSSAYCGTNAASNAHLLCMNAVYNGTSVTTLTQSDNGNAILSTSKFPLAYVTNATSNTISLCPVNADGTFGACLDSGNTGAAFAGVRGIVSNFTNTIAYVVNQSTNSVLKCPINSNGTFGACVDSGNSGVAFNFPTGIALNPTGTFAYVTNVGNNTVSTCPVNSDGTFGACVNSGSSFVNPFGIVLNSAGNFAYVVNTNNNSVSKCSVNSNGTFDACADSGSSGFAFNGPRYIELNSAGTAVYVSNAGNNTVSLCPVNPDGTFGFCTPSGNTGAAFNGPRGIIFNPANSFSYVNNSGNGIVLKCPVNVEGTLGACADSGNSGVAFNGPNGSAWSIRESM